MSIQSFSNKQYIPASAPLVQTIKYNGLVFISGCIPLTKQGKIIEGDISLHGKVALEWMKDALARAGTTPSRVLKVTCFFGCNLEQVPQFNEVYGNFFNEYNHKPCRTGVKVAGLPSIDGVQALVEIECVAAVE
ncbi:YabJ-like protein [Wallemia mellicola]|nr:YabJ-like protein [Wallemia mellicola]